jgi:hypothetical protein
MGAPDWYPDTDPKALKVFLELQRKMSPAEKTAGVFQINEMLRRPTEARERQLHPRERPRNLLAGGSIAKR